MITLPDDNLPDELLPGENLPDQQLLDDLAWLAGPGAQDLFDQIGPAPPDQLDMFGLVSQLQKRMSQQRVHLLLEQVEQRYRARAKFPSANRMFFTPLGLQQATDHWVAQYKASRFESVVGDQPIADLCCGVGGDLLALSGRGPAIGVDRDPMTACFAADNLRTIGSSHASEVRTADILDVDLSQFAAWHIDPDRRPDGDRRTTRPELHEPSLSTVRKLLDVNPNGAIKLAPAAELPDEWSHDVELEWVVRDRQCRQQIVWCGDLAKSPGQRRATVVRAIITDDDDAGNADHGPSISLDSFVGDPDVPVEMAQQVGQYLYEPNAAVLAAQIWGSLASELGLKAPNRSIPYLTSDEKVDSPMLATFRVEAAIPLDRKRLRKLLRERDTGRLEIKKRGVSINPEHLRRELKLKGDQPATLIICPIGKRTVAVLVERIG